MKKIFLIILISIFIPELALAAPSISVVSGNLTHGANVTVFGSSFGTKSPSTPFIWDNMEHNTIGQPPQISANIGNWLYIENTDQAQTVTNIKYGGDKATHFNTGQDGRSFVFRNVMTDGSKVYIFGKRRYNGTFTYNTNQKLLYIYVRDKWPGTPSLVFSTFTGGVWGVQNCDLGHWMNNVSWISGEWYTEEWELGNSSGLNRSDGVIRYIRNGVKEAEQLDARYRCLGEEGYLSDFYMSNYSDTPMEIWEDDLYIDTTWARVMICKGDQWSIKGICEIQIPTAWSQNSITISANQGAFQSGQQAYLYVVDSNGEVNANGYPVTIGGGGDTTPPNPPANLKVR